MTGEHPVEIDTTRPHPARMYDWYLGGKDNYPVDEAMGRQMLALEPRVPVMARVNRAFMQRATRWLAGQGVRQFLDIGTGIPTEPNLHQIAQRVAPDARVVYCDNDPIVLAHAAALLRGTEEGVTEYLQADVREPDLILEGARKVLDFDRPIAIALVAHRPAALRPRRGRRARAGGTAGGRPALGQPSGDQPRHGGLHPEESEEATAKLKGAGVTLALRSREEFTRFFDGLDLVDPGVEVPHLWHPELGDPVPGQDDGVIPGYGAVARKP